MIRLLLVVLFAATSCTKDGVAPNTGGQPPKEPPISFKPALVLPIASPALQDGPYPYVAKLVTADQLCKRDGAELVPLRFKQKQLPQPVDAISFKPDGSREIVKSDKILAELDCLKPQAFKQKTLAYGYAFGTKTTRPDGRIEFSGVRFDLGRYGQFPLAAATHEYVENSYKNIIRADFCKSQGLNSYIDDKEFNARPTNPSEGPPKEPVLVGDYFVFPFIFDGYRDGRFNNMHPSTADADFIFPLRDGFKSNPAAPKDFNRGNWFLRVDNVVCGEDPKFTFASRQQLRSSPAGELDGWKKPGQQSLFQLLNVKMNGHPIANTMTRFDTPLEIRVNAAGFEMSNGLKEIRPILYNAAKLEGDLNYSETHNFYHAMEDGWELSNNISRACKSVAPHSVHIPIRYGGPEHIGFAGDGWLIPKVRYESSPVIDAVRVDVDDMVEWLGNSYIQYKKEVIATQGIVENVSCFDLGVPFRMEGQMRGFEITNPGITFDGDSTVYRFATGSTGEGAYLNNFSPSLVCRLFGYAGPIRVYGQINIEISPDKSDSVLVFHSGVTGVRPMPTRYVTKITCGI